MRITAQFYSADDADFAAAALRRETDGVFDVAVREKRVDPHRDGNFAPMGFFTNINTGAASSVPVAIGGTSAESSAVPVYGMGDDAVKIYPDEPKSATVDVICRQSAAKKVSSILISKGGHNIRTT